MFPTSFRRIDRASAGHVPSVGEFLCVHFRHRMGAGLILTRTLNQFRVRASESHRNCIIRRIVARKSRNWTIIMQPLSMFRTGIWRFSLKDVSLFGRFFSHFHHIDRFLKDRTRQPDAGLNVTASVSERRWFYTGARS